MRTRGEWLGLWAVFGGVAACCGSAAWAGERFVSYSGQAVAADTGAFLYGESHLLHYRDDRLLERVVSYTCHSGGPFARKEVDYVTPLAPDFVLDDASSGIHDGVRGGHGPRTVFFRRSPREAEKSALLEASADLVVDVGFDGFIRSRWQTLMSGHPQSFPFVVPSRVGTMNFSVRHLRSGVAEGAPSEVFELKAAGILGWIVPPIVVQYGADKVLVTYDGVTDLHEPGGDNFKAHIVFPPAKIKEVGSSALEEARRAELRPCGP